MSLVLRCFLLTVKEFLHQCQAGVGRQVVNSGQNLAIVVKERTPLSICTEEPLPFIHESVHSWNNFVLLKTPIHNGQKSLLKRITHFNRTPSPHIIQFPPSGGIPRQLKHQFSPTNFRLTLVFSRNQNAHNAGNNLF